MKTLDPLNRKWKIRPYIHFQKLNSCDTLDKPEYNKHLYFNWNPLKKFAFQIDIGIAQFLIQFKGKKVIPHRPIANFGIQFRPFNWRLGSNHIYYDGRHCLYYLGPIWIENSWGFNCKKCMP